MTESKKKYEAKRVFKNVSFNTDNDDDKRRLEFVGSINFSEWVKQQIDDEINPTAQQQHPT